MSVWMLWTINNLERKLLIVHRLPVAWCLKLTLYTKLKFEVWKSKTFISWSLFFNKKNKVSLKNWKKYQRPTQINLTFIISFFGGEHVCLAWKHGSFCSCYTLWQLRLQYGITLHNENNEKSNMIAQLTDYKN